jgi:hypothetical protein
LPGDVVAGPIAFAGNILEHFEFHIMTGMGAITMKI